jgi:hypothetical protein
MNCREFRRKHDGYVDDTLSGVEMEAMGRHVRLCDSCARLDTRIRRSLLIAHNLPAISPSAAFSERLELRLAQERALRASMPGHGEPSRVRRPFGIGSYVALGAGIALAAGLATTMVIMGRYDDAITMDPVVASLPEPEPSPLATPAMIASMPVGMPVWPAVFVAQQVPWHLTNDSGR